MLRFISIVVLLAGCGSATPAPRAQPPRPEPEPLPVAVLTIGRVTLSMAEETAIALEPDGRIVHASCEARLDADGTMRDPSGATTMRLETSGTVVDGDGHALFRIDETGLQRAAGGSARIEGDRVIVEGSPDVAFTVARDAGVDDRTVLVLVAALSVCEG